MWIAGLIPERWPLHQIITCVSCLGFTGTTSSSAMFTELLGSWEESRGERSSALEWLCCKQAIKHYHQRGRGLITLKHHNPVSCLYTLKTSCSPTKHHYIPCGLTSFQRQLLRTRWPTEAERQGSRSSKSGIVNSDWQRLPSNVGKSFPHFLLLDAFHWKCQGWPRDLIYARHKVCCRVTASH